MFTYKSPMSILRNKTDELLSGNTFERFTPIPERDRTAYAWASTDTAAHGEAGKHPAVLGFGYLHAVLSMLTLSVRTVSLAPPGLKGRIEVQTGASGIAYSFSWNEEGEDYCQQGGFIHDGNPNFHSAVLGMVQCIGMYLSGERLQSHEVVTRWVWLLRDMERRNPRLDRAEGWPSGILPDVCRDPVLRSRLLQCCDSLRVAMQYQIATQTRRGVMVTEGPVLEPHEVSFDDEAVQHLKGPDLLDWRLLLERAGATPLLPTPKPVSEEELEPLKAEVAKEKEKGPATLPDLLAETLARAEGRDRKPGGKAKGSKSKEEGITEGAVPEVPEGGASVGEKVDGVRGIASLRESVGTAGEEGVISPLAAAVMARTPHPVPRTDGELFTLARAEPPKPAPSTMRGPYIEQVDMIVAQGGTVLCTGPTGTGKTEIFLEHALRNSWGVELIVLHGGKKIYSLQGSYVRGSDGDFRFASGPLTRFALRTMNGERVMLLLDELARAEEKVFAYVMDLLNTFSPVQVLSMRATGDGSDEEMKLVLPPDFGEDPTERYHIVTLDALQQRYVLPASRVRIVGTANQGEGYEGHEFRDPAFLRRWYHWIHFAGYSDGVTRSILAERLHLREGATLIEAMIQIKNQVHAYHAKEDTLKMTLCLPLLITWGEQTLWYLNNAASSMRGSLRPAFDLAARTSWVNRVCPYKADGLDPEVEVALLDIIRSASL